jgi:RNA polymerase sigma-70 factor (ECF subfamily)
VEERELVKGLVKGKESAYYEIVNLYGNKLLRSCFLIIRDIDEAEDIVQETFMRVFKYIKSFRGDSSLYTWIYKISQNVLKDKLKKIIDTSSYVYEAIDYESPEEIVISNLDREILKSALSNLSFVYKQVLVMFYFDELSIKEISEILEEKEGTIKSRLSRGRLMLKDVLERGGELYE